MGSITASELVIGPDKLKTDLAWAADHFHDMELRAEQSLQRGELLAAAVWAQIAADFAWHRHPGFYASPALETLLIQVAEALKESSAERINLSGGAALSGISSKPRILHVITNALPTGGHTRLMTRLMQNSSDRYVHSLATTGQKAPLPDWVISAVKSSGGWYTSLSLASPHLLKRAALLRQLGRSRADIVFLHTNPNDVLPLVAFGVDGGPPVVFSNHADHVFWLGTSVADVVADLRLSGQALSLSRRGARVSRILPIPLSEPGPEMSNSLARAKLGIDGDAVVLLTIASPYKYTAFGGYDFIDAVTEILARNKKAILLAVGPSMEGRWLESSRRLNGRIKALGYQTDLQMFHACADVYLDSFPFASFTSMLDTGIRGVPVVGLSNPQVPIFSDLDITPEQSRSHVVSLEDYMALLGRMIADPDFRRAKGDEGQAQIRATHLLPGWDEYLKAVMRALPNSHSVVRKLELSTAMDTNDIFLTGFNALNEAHYTRSLSLAKNGRYFPFTTRADLLLQGLRGGERLPSRAWIGELPRFLLKRVVSLFNQKRY